MFEGIEEFHSKHILKEQPEPDSDAIDIGDVAHQIVLRGRDKNSVARLIPRDVLQWNRNGVGSRKGSAWESFELQCQIDGVIPLLERDWNAIDRIINKIHQNDIARRMLGLSERTEATCEWQDEETGLLFRVMFDCIGPTFVGDLKTTSKPLRDPVIARHIETMGYYLQAAFYLRAARAMGYRNPKFVFMFQKNKPPFTCRCFEIDPEQLKEIDNQISHYAKLLAVKIENDDWSSDHGKLTTLSLSRNITRIDQWSNE